MPLSAQVDLGLPVTRAMQPVQTAVRCDQTVQQALEDLRTRRIGHHIVYVYALGAGGRPGFRLTEGEREAPLAGLA